MAHSPIPGIATFYSGALHPFVVPAQLLALASLGLLTGQRGIANSGMTTVALTVSLGAGLAASAAVGSPDTDLMLLGAAMLLGLGVALARPLPNRVLVLLAILIGLLAGVGSDPEGLRGGARWGWLAGSWLGGTLCVLWLAAMSEAAQGPRTKIAVRVVASWLTASAMLVLALAWLGPGRAGKPPRLPATVQSAVQPTMSGTP